jgi:hypothetical protein
MPILEYIIVQCANVRVYTAQRLQSRTRGLVHGKHQNLSAIPRIL